MREIFQLLDLAAPTDATVLLLGETGTGKELIARAIHRNSPRREGPFVVVNCAAIPETLLESDLFGHERGAFTGAASRKTGRFASAHGGTIFLDEIGELPLAVQAKILRVLQFKEFEPLGSHASQKVDVRIIAATNRSLTDEVREGRFREDLFYRLNVVALTLPPLRSRREDIPVLAYYFFDNYTRKNKRSIQEIEPGALQRLKSYSWPGNIRELENVIERAVIFCTGKILTAANLPEELQAKVEPPGPGQGLGDHEPSLMDLEKELIFRTLEKVGNKRQQAAQILGISQEELDFKLRAYHWRGE
jgi:two-component system NtrC family response regulator/two-component system response regulator HydG